MLTRLALGPTPGPDLPDQQWQDGVRVMMSEPSLQGDFLKGGTIIEAELAAAIAERTGTDAARDLYPRLVAGAVGAAIRVVTEQWLHAEPPVPITSLMETRSAGSPPGCQNPDPDPRTRVPVTRVSVVGFPYPGFRTRASVPKPASSAATPSPRHDRSPVRESARRRVGSPCLRTRPRGGPSCPSTS